MTRFPARAAATLAAALSLAGPLAAEETGAQTVVATVNGTEITLGDIVAVRSELPAQIQNLPDQFLYDGILQQLVDTTLARQAADAAGLADEPAIARALDRQRGTFLADAFMRRAMREAVTEAALRERYEDEYASAEPVREIRASHILVADEALAQEIRAELDAGADFAALAAEHGTDGTRDRGGDLGFFGPEMMVPAFADAAFALSPGETAGPVQTQFGWHLIRVTEERERPVPGFEEVEDQLADALGREAIEDLIASLRDDAEIDVAADRPGLDALRDDSLIAR